MLSICTKLFSSKLCRVNYTSFNLRIIFLLCRCRRFRRFRRVFISNEADEEVSVKRDKLDKVAYSMNLSPSSLSLSTTIMKDLFAI